MVIEQYTVTTKYNFPQPSVDTTLPQRFLEQSLHSLKQIPQPYQLNPRTPPFDITDTNPTNLQLKPIPITLKANHQETLVAAADTSTIKIGETTTGIVVAMRGAITWRQNRAYKYTRLGPFIFHITEDNKNQLYNTLEKAYFSVNYGNHQTAPNLLQAPTRLASLLERWMQTMLAKTVNQGVLLLDGSLTAGTFDTPVQRLKDVLNHARNNQTTVLAFSKATTLRANGILITEQLPNENPPYLLQTTGLHAKLPQVLLGDIYVARLSRANLAFRLDTDRETEFSLQLDGIQKLIGNDFTNQSYPETLRLAHILCTFTANEVLAMKHFLTRKHSIQIFNRPDVHKLLFGSYGYGGELYA